MSMHIASLPAIDLMPLAEVEEKREVGLVMTGPAWKAVCGSIELLVRWEVDIRDAREESWKRLLPGFTGDVVYAVGGGLAVDAAKFIAARKDLPLVCVPTALSVDAFLTSASGVRQDGCVRYIPTRPPDRLVIDLEQISNAPAAVRASGICDVLSIATGLWDWQFAEENGQNPEGMRYDPAAAKMAGAILEAAFECAPAAGSGDPEGLKRLLDCLAMEVALCNLIGHSRPEEGSEHYFAYAVENELGKGRTHGELVGPGILLMARIQGQETARLEEALRACQVPLDTIPQATTNQVLPVLADYAYRHHLPFGIAHTLK